MKRLLTTTAIVAVAAAPLAAASEYEPRQVTDAVGTHGITVAQLINRDVYVMTEGDSRVTWSDWTEVPDDFRQSGEIEDLLLNSDGQIDTIVVGKGGLLDIGDTEVQVDVGKFGVVMDADDEGDFYIVYTGDASELQSAKAYHGPDDASATAMNGETPQTAGDGGQNTNQEVVENASRGGVRGASNVQRSSTQAEMEAAGQDLMGYASAESESGGAGKRWTTTSARTAQRESAARGDYFGAAPTVDQAGFTMVSTDSLTTEDLEWVPVYTADGEWVGEIGDLALDPQGEISEAIVDMGGFLGIGETPVAVPFDKVTIERDDDTGAMRAYVRMDGASIERLKTEAAGS